MMMGHEVICNLNNNNIDGWELINLTNYCYYCLIILLIIQCINTWIYQMFLSDSDLDTVFCL